MVLLHSHHITLAYSGVVRNAMDWNIVHEQIDTLRTAVRRLAVPVRDMADARSSQINRERLSLAAEELTAAINRLESAVDGGRAAPDLVSFNQAMDHVKQTARGAINQAGIVLKHFDEGDRASAFMARVVFGQDIDLALQHIDHIAQALRSEESNLALRELENSGLQQRLEFFLIVLILVLGGAAATYGRYLREEKRSMSEMRGELQVRVAELSREQADLKLQNAQLEATLDSTLRGVCLFDVDESLVFANRRYYEIYGFSPSDVFPGMTMRDILRVRIAHGHFANCDPDAHYADRLTSVAARRGSIKTLEMPDGRLTKMSIYPTTDGGWVSMHDDVTDERLTQQRIVHLAHHDALTGLTNRLRFGEELQAALERIERGGHFAVLCLDLDHFKQVNDTLGHPVGDKLLQAVASRLKACVRKADIVARIGGDEFAIIQVIGEQPIGSTALATRVIDEMAKPFVIDEHRIVAGVSIGIAIAPFDGRTAESLLKHADLALYRAKTDGRGSFRLFEAEMDARMQQRRTLEFELRRALALNQFELFYQPLIDTRTLTVNGFEALLRWRHPERGLVPPMSFIPIAEEIGLMGEIGSWVLKQGCMDAATWPGQMRVAINVSPAQFRGRPLELDVMTALSASGLAPERLELEITESVLLEDSKATIDILTQLRTCGIRIAMDDFGTGYSSLSYLLSFPFDKIKLDRSFTQSLCALDSAQSIVQAVIGLGKGLGVLTTAEGVETEEQLEHLRQEGCSEVQGFLFSKPVPAAQIPGLLRRLAQPLSMVS